MIAPDYISAGEDAPIIDSGAAAAAVWRAHVIAPQLRPGVEWTMALLLNKDRRLIGYMVPESDGAAGWVMVPRRRMLRAVLRSNAASVVLLHQHTVDVLEASDKDRMVVQGAARLLNDLDSTLIDFVIMDRSGERWNSLAESGELEARAAALHDLKAGSYERALETILQFVDSADRRLNPMVSEAAALAGLSMPEWLAEFLFAGLLARFTPEPLEDRRLAVFGELHRRDPDSALRALDAARFSGKGVSAFVFDRAIDLLVEEFRPAGPAPPESVETDFNSEAAERGAAVTELT